MSDVDYSQMRSIADEPHWNTFVQSADGKYGIAAVASCDTEADDYHREFTDDPERIEYFVPIRWLRAVPLDQDVNEIGLFGHQNTVCKPTTPKWRSTVERLKERWPAVA